MLDSIQTILSFIVALGVLITVHEYGHFWVARRCGVKVLKFSVGFGAPLFSWRDKLGTEYVIASIPLGGYVKMYGEQGEDDGSPGATPEPINESESFSHKTVWQRIAIVAAGPIVNLVFAVLLYGLIFSIGVTRLVPLVGEVQPESPAAVAGLSMGDEIVAIDGKATPSWPDVNFALINRIGDSGTLTLEVKPHQSSITRTYALPIERWLLDDEAKSPLPLLGFDVFEPEGPVILANVLPGKAAERAGLQVGDQIIATNDEPITRWMQWVHMIKASPGEPLLVTVLRDGKNQTFTVLPDVVEESGQSYGRLGVSPQPREYPDDLKREISYGPIDALGRAAIRTADLIVLTLKSLGKMITGEISLDNVSGPLTIAKTAGDTARFGWEPFLSFVAYLSISLGVLNLLPIPVLDGGHLMYYAMEIIKGRPVSEKIRALGNSLGLVILVAFMGLAIYNDVVRL